MFRCKILPNVTRTELKYTNTILILPFFSLAFFFGHTNLSNISEILIKVTFNWKCYKKYPMESILLSRQFQGVNTFPWTSFHFVVSIEQMKYCIYDRHILKPLNLYISDKIYCLISINNTISINSTKQTYLEQPEWTGDKISLCWHGNKRIGKRIWQKWLWQLIWLCFANENWKLTGQANTSVKGAFGR